MYMYTPVYIYVWGWLESVEPKRGVRKPTAFFFQRFPSGFMTKLRTAVPNKNAYFHTKEIGENDKP